MNVDLYMGTTTVDQVAGDTCVKRYADAPISAALLWKGGGKGSYADGHVMDLAISPQDHDCRLEILAGSEYLTSTKEIVGLGVTKKPHCLSPDAPAGAWTLSSGLG